MRNKSFAYRIKKALEYRDKHPVDIYLNTPIDKANLSRYIHGQAEPKKETIQIIADYLDVSPLFLMGYIDEYVMNVPQKTVDDYERVSLMNEIENICFNMNNEKLKTVITIMKGLK